MSLTVQRSDLFPVGTAVRAFRLPQQGIAEYRPVGEPGAPAAFVEQQTVNAAGELTFGALEPETPHVLWANVAGADRYLFVRDSQASEGMSRSPHAWVIPGSIVAETLPGLEIDPAVGETQRLVRVGYRVREPENGTVTFTIQRNGVNVPGLVGLTAGAAASHTAPAPVTLAAGDELTCVITAVANAPKGLTVTVHLEHQPSD